MKIKNILKMTLLLMNFLSLSAFAEGRDYSGIYHMEVNFGDRKFTDILILASPKGIKKLEYNGSLTVPGNFSAKIKARLDKKNESEYQLFFELRTKEFNRPLNLDYKATFSKDGLITEGKIIDIKSKKTIGNFLGSRIYHGKIY